MLHIPSDIIAVEKVSNCLFHISGYTCGSCCVWAVLLRLWQRSISLLTPNSLVKYNKNYLVLIEKQSMSLYFTFIIIAIIIRFDKYKMLRLISVKISKKLSLKIALVLGQNFE